MNLEDAIKIGQDENAPVALVRQAAGVMGGAIVRLDSLLHHWRNVGWMDRDLVMHALRPPE